MQGKMINTVMELHEAALAKRSVTCGTGCFKGPIPAAFVMNLQGTVLLRLFKDGMYLYMKPTIIKKVKEKKHE